MTVSDDEDESLAQFLESEVLSEISDQEEEGSDEKLSGKKKFLEETEKDDSLSGERECLEEDIEKDERLSGNRKCIEDDENVVVLRKKNKLKRRILDEDEDDDIALGKKRRSWRIEGGVISMVPPEIFPHILKFLSSEDLVACSLVCKFLNFVASDEALWSRLYSMRWGLVPPTKKLQDRAWKKLYIQRDEEDMVAMVRNCPNEFKEYYVQMQAAKRSQAPLPSQVKDDRMILDQSVADQVSIWKSNKGLTDKVFFGHDCSGETCSYHQIGDVFVCENTGHVHVCDDTCKEVVFDPTNGNLVCTISGHCFDRLMSPAEIEEDLEQQQGVVTDDAEPFMGSGRFARAYLLGYNCDDEKELEAALRFC